MCHEQGQVCEGQDTWHVLLASDLTSMSANFIGTDFKRSMHICAIDLPPFSACLQETLRVTASPCYSSSRSHTQLPLSC